MYVKELISDYCVLDIETTGLSPYYDDIIEIGILRIRNDSVTDRYSQLINPGYSLPAFITELTGITDEMLSGKPSLNDVKNKVLDFIGSDTIVGHNTYFDVKFLEEKFNVNINKYIDTMQFSRKLYPDLAHHRLSDMVQLLNLSNNEHRAIADCVSTKELYDSIKSLMKERNLQISDLWSKHNKGIDISQIKPENVEIDKDNFFYGRHIVFTGKLEKMVRKDAMQLVVNLGGILDNSVTKETNYLILGSTDYNPSLRGEKSSKQKKAEALKFKGQDIEVIDELTFYDLLK